MIFLSGQKGNEPNFSSIDNDRLGRKIIGGETSCKRDNSNLELVLADPPNQGLVLQVVHCPPPQHLLRQAGVGHHGLSL